MQLFYFVLLIIDIVGWALTHHVLETFWEATSQQQ